MDPPLREAYKKLEEDVKNALKEHRGNQSVMSVALNALMLYPDRPFRLGNLFGWEYDPVTQRLCGNFPQAFSHVSLVNTAWNLSAEGGPAHRRRGDGKAPDPPSGSPA